MIQGTLRSWSTYLGAVLASSFLVACVINEPPKRQPLNTRADEKAAVDDTETETDPIEPETNPNSGAFGKDKPSTSSSSGTIATKKYCPTPLAAGDLVVVEIMVSSKSGSGDYGEWVEIKNTRDCWLKLDNVTVASPRGSAATDSVTIDGVELSPGSTIVVADSLDTSKNHDLPGKVFSWDASDVLKNDGDTILVKAGEVEIDKVTYPSLTITPGASIAFPSDCGADARTDWTKWTSATEAYGATFKGTPNAHNGDVTCN